MKKKEYSNITIFKRTIKEARPYWLHISIIFLLTLLTIPIALIKPLTLKVLIDNGFGNHPIPGYIKVFFPSNYEFTFFSIVAIAAGSVIVIALVEQAIMITSWILSTFTGEKLVLDFRTRLFNHIQRLSLAYHDTTGSSDSLYRIQWDTAAVRTFLLNNIAPLLSSFLTLIAMIAVMFTINVYFALISLSVIPPLIFLIRYSSSKLKENWEFVKDEESSAMSVLHEVLSSLRVVKAFGQEKGEEERFVKKSGRVIKRQVKLAWIGALFYLFVAIIFAIGTALFIYLGATYVHEGRMTLGELIIMMSYLGMVFGPLQSISKILTDLQSSITSIERVFALMDKEKEVTERPDAVHLQKAKGSFAFKDVGFGYTKEKLTLKNVSFEIMHGERVGIMGSTGAGKSTLVSLLMRFYDATNGTIKVDGRDIQDYKLKDYRNQFSIVLQEPVLFSTTIYENIKYGKPGATEEEVIAAAKAANAHEFIIRCENGYDTLVGERGMQLSGGERQRISIARAFIKNAPILILDEPTSSLDVRTEAQIMEAMERLMEGRTTFMITHRLDTLNSCNVILHLEKGELVDFIRDYDKGVIEMKKKAMQFIKV